MSQYWFGLSLLAWLSQTCDKPLTESDLVLWQHMALQGHNHLNTFHYDDIPVLHVHVIIQYNDMFMMSMNVVSCDVILLSMMIFEIQCPGLPVFLYCTVHPPRPMSQSGRPLSGFVRPGTQGGRPGTMEQAIRTPRTAHTARPVTSASGRYVRLGTVSRVNPCHSELSRVNPYLSEFILGNNIDGSGHGTVAVLLPGFAIKW